MFGRDDFTTKGQPAEDDFKMVEDLGFEIIIGDHEAHQEWKARQGGAPTVASCETNECSN